MYLNSTAQIIKPVLPNISKDFRNIRDFTLYKDEAYFSAQNTSGNLSTIVRVRNENQQWMQPEITSFSGKYHDIEPYISYKNKDENWSPAKNMGNKVNSIYMDYCPYVDTKNNILFLPAKEIEMMLLVLKPY